MQQNKLSVICPSIYPKLWQRFLDTLLNSYSGEFEILFIGPNAIGGEGVLEDPRCRFINSYYSPTVCFQYAILEEAKHEIIFLTSDDSMFYPNAIDVCVTQLLSSGRVEVGVNARYREGWPGEEGGGKYEFPPLYWKAAGHQNLTRARHIHGNYDLLIQTVMWKQYFMDLGGFNCQYEFSPFAHNDLSFRIQKLNGSIIQSAVEVANLDRMDFDTHKPIEDAQSLNDEPLFTSIYNSDNGPQLLLDPQDYKNYLFPWKRRFPKEYEQWAQNHTT